MKFKEGDRVIFRTANLYRLSWFNGRKFIIKDYQSSMMPGAPTPSYWVTDLDNSGNFLLREEDLELDKKGLREQKLKELFWAV